MPSRERERRGHATALTAASTALGSPEIFTIPLSRSTCTRAPVRCWISWIVDPPLPERARREKRGEVRDS